MSEHWKLRLQTTDNGVLKKSLTNARIILEHHGAYRGKLRTNLLTGMVELDGRQMTDADVTPARLALEAQGLLGTSAEGVSAIMDLIAAANAYDPLVDYLTSLAWDFKPRIADWLQVYMGVADSPYVASVGSKWLIAAAARALMPGCKADNMLVIEGPQDIGKSSALRALAGDAMFVEHTADLKNHQRLVETMQGKWIVEFAELAAVSRSDVEMAKAIITTQVDRVRLSYARRAGEYPRRCVMAATVNPRGDGGYLTDDTGNRRFWPVRATGADVAGIRAMRDQLWAEAVHRFRDGDPWWLTGDERVVAAAEQTERVTTDPWIEHLSACDRLDRYQLYTTSQVLGMIGVRADLHDRRMANRAATCMRALGWTYKLVKIGGHPARRWCVERG